MKLKKVFLGIAMLFSFAVLAQEKGDFSGFAGVSYPLASGADLGINAGVEYVFAENFSAAPSFTYYTTSGATNTGINLDIRYYLGDESFNWFLTSGLLLTNTKVGGFSASGTGFTGGAGALFSLSDSMNLLTVVKYNSEVVGGGVEPMVGISFSF